LENSTEGEDIRRSPLEALERLQQRRHFLDEQFRESAGEMIAKDY
jgi:hypothetical protein